MAVSVTLQTHISPKYVFPRQEELSINYNACIPKSMKTSPHPQLGQANMSEKKDQGNFKGLNVIQNIKIIQSEKPVLQCLETSPTARAAGCVNRSCI